MEAIAEVEEGVRPWCFAAARTAAAAAAFTTAVVLLLPARVLIWCLRAPDMVEVTRANPNDRWQLTKQGARGRFKVFLSLTAVYVDQKIFVLEMTGERLFVVVATSTLRSLNSFDGRIRCSSTQIEGRLSTATTARNRLGLGLAFTLWKGGRGGREKYRSQMACTRGRT